jgi:mannose/fructose/N-acetylgalactosamine-specific phosphotransferase system component IID
MLMPNNLGTNAYISSCLAGAAAPVAFCIVIPVMMKLGRRVSMGGTLVTMGILLSVSAIVMHFKCMYTKVFCAYNYCIIFTEVPFGTSL